MKFFILAIIALLNLESAPAMDSIIDPNTPLDGRFEMTITIGEKTYVDFLNLNGKDAPIRMSSFGGQIIGSITVPGNFESPLQGQGRCTLWGSFCEFQFEIVAHENGIDFKVIYKADFARSDYIRFLNGEVHQVSLTGTAYLENGNVLGTFKAIRTNQ